MGFFLADEETMVRMMIADMLEELGHSVVAEAATIDLTLRITQTARFDIVILDINVAESRINHVAGLTNDASPSFLRLDMDKRESRKSIAIGR